MGEKQVQRKGKERGGRLESSNHSHKIKTSSDSSTEAAGVPSRPSWSAADRLCPNRSLKALLLADPSRNPGGSLIVVVHPGLGSMLNTATLTSPGQL